MSLIFNADDPFPLLESGKHSYKEQQEHSAIVDQWLGLNTEETEALISANPNQQLWLKIPVAAMQTPYSEIREILSHFDVQRKLLVVDLGSAYGRMGFVIARHFPNWNFIGYEVVPERVARSREALSAHPCDRVRFEVADLNDENVTPEAGDIFFIYDYGTRDAIGKTLVDLQAIAKQKTITVIGRGRASRDAIERNHPWLSQVENPEHYPHYSLYRSCKAP
jgi:hypothetical protein